MRAESTSDGLWAADLTRDMQSGKGGNNADMKAALAAKGKGGNNAKGGNKGRETKVKKGAQRRRQRSYN